MKNIYFTSFYTKGDGCFDLSPIVNEVNKALHCISYVSECGGDFYAESFICLKTK